MLQNCSGEKEIVFFINSLSGGGAEGVCVNIANCLSDRGWKVTLLVLHLNNAVRKKNLSNKIELIVLGRRHTRNAALPLLLYLIRNKPTRILVFNHQLAILLVALRSILFFKFNIIARNINTLSKKKESENSLWHKHIVHYLTRIFYKNVDSVIAQSKGMAEDLQLHYDVPKEKISTIHNPVSAIVENYSIPASFEKGNYLLCVGRLEPQKAFHYAISGFSMLAPHYPELRLKLLGEGSLENDLREQVNSLGLTDRVDFVGYQADIIPYYLSARSTLLTSIYEGFPNVLVESVALGTPVVAFDCPSGPGEIIVEGVNGYLVEMGNVFDLVKNIKVILENEMDRDLIRGTSVRFGLDIIIKEYESVISTQ